MEIAQVKKGKHENTNVKFSFSHQQESLSSISPDKTDHITSSIKIEDIKDRISKEGESNAIEKLSTLVSEYA